MRQLRLIFSKFRHSVRLSKPSTPDPVLLPTIASTSPNCLVPVSESSQAKSICASSRLNTPLENLPPEVRRQLLSIVELEELCALVHASPVFHQQYLLDRRSLLCGCLETTLGSITPDACAVYRSGIATFSDTRTSEKVTQFLKSYHDQRSSAQYSILAERFTEDEAVGMVAFYSSIIKPLARVYTSWALANLADETKDVQNHEPLSRTEKTRLLRALYRFQLGCSLFGKGHHGTSLQPQLGFRSVDILKVFFCIFEPWEIEEIACIYAFSKEKYNQIFDNIRWDVHEKNPKFEGQRPPTPEGAFDLDNSWVRECLLKGTISHGLELLYTVFTIRDHAHLVSTMQEHISWPAGEFLEDALSETAQFQRRQERLSNGDRKQQRCDPLPFSGDSEDRLCPPLAWTLIWRGTYSNLYGYYVQDVTRRWGYVMWDATRLEHTNAKEVLARQWEADWGDDDPRNNIL